MSSGQSEFDVEKALDPLQSMAKEVDIEISSSYIEELKNYSMHIGVSNKRENQKIAAFRIMGYISLVNALAMERGALHAAAAREVILTIGKHDDPNQTCKKTIESILENLNRWKKVLPEKFAATLEF